MDHQAYPNIQPVPSSVMDFRAAQSHMQALQQQERTSSQRAPQVSPDEYYAAPQHPVAYSHGYPTPPSRPSALSPVVDAQQQQRMLANSQNGTSTMTPPSRGGPLPPAGQSSSRPNLDTFSSAYPTPPARQSALLSPNASVPRGANNFHAAAFSRLDTHAQHSSVSQLYTPTEPRLPQPAHSSVTPQASSSAYGAPHQQWPPQPGPSTAPQPPQSAHILASHLPPRQASASVSNSAVYGAPHQLRSSFVMPAPPNLPTNLPVQAHHSQGTFTAPPASRSSSQLPTPPDARPQQPPYIATTVPVLSGSSHPSSHLPTPTSAHPPHPSTLTTSQSATDTPLRSFLESAWAAYTRDLEQNVNSLNARIQEVEAENTRLTTERENTRNTVGELVGTVEGQRAQLNRVVTESSKRAKQAADTETRLRNERNEARRQCEELQKERDALSQQCSTSGALLMQSAQDRDALAALNRDNAQLKAITVALSQKMSAYRPFVERLTQERNDLRARLESSAQAAMVVPKPEVTIKPEPDLTPKSEHFTYKSEHLTPKSELLDELELQYPPEPAAPEEPIASTSASATMPAPSFDSAVDADASASSSTFYTWDLPPGQEDRKRSRAEYEADGDGADVDADADGDTRGAARPRLQSPPTPTPTLGPEFPQMQFPELRSIDVKALNSPVRFFMEVRRKQQGG